ncbi:DUF262 domain-containing HNH endonuclease family protein [Myceligenerans crystallogenes]|uniref:DUF262 domain-containing protein n=1 Tax=Myceligenerans crystallogenes TaxID=316335 RepID=A0ABN2NLG4_9MICO
MKADTLTPSELFGSKVHYEVPPYQRPYVWNEEDQWAPLWDDVVRVATNEILDPPSDKDATSLEHGHFLGAVVYESVPPIAGDVTRHKVIDGQQRTTTLQLLLDAIQQVFVERGHTDLAEDLEALVLNSGSKFKGRRERFKLWPSRTDREAFAHAMDPQPVGPDEHRIVAAHRFFRQEAATWLEGKPDPDGNVPPGDEPERAQALSTVLQLRLVLVAINLASSEESQLIFETLNDRGTPLLKADLIKNWVFQQGDAVGADVEAWPETHWADFDDEWWRTEIAQGRLLRSRIDIFLQYWLTMRTRAEVPTDGIFHRFTAHARPQMKSADDAEALLAALRKDADTFRSFAQLTDGRPAASFYHRVIETMELAAASPLLLWMLSTNHVIPADQIRIGLEAFESWVVRRTLLRYTMKDVNKMVVAILKELGAAPVEQAGDTVRHYLARQTADARLWPTDAEVVKVLPTVKLYGNVRQSRIRVVLEAVERSLWTGKHDLQSIPAGLEIEHVMPRGWRTHWQPTPLSPEAAADRDQRVNQIGNLTLLAKSLNASLSNRPWTDAEAQDAGTGATEAGLGKRSLIEKYSQLVLSKNLVTDHVDVWTDGDIEARSVFLAETICKVWPR